MAAKKTLDMASEIDSPCHDIVPMQEDQGAGDSKGRKRKKCLMCTPLRPFGAAPDSPQGGTSKKVKKEQEDHYEPRKTFTCNVCERSYVHTASLKRHLNTHSWEKMYPCQYCDQVFALAEYRTKHELAHTGEKRYQCLLCNNTLVNYSLLITHCRQVHNTHPSGRKERRRRRVDDGNDTVYRVLPCKTLKLQSRDCFTDINEEGIVNITPSRGHLADHGLQTPGASTRPRVHAQPGSHADPPSPCGAEFEFIIPETY